MEKLLKQIYKERKPQLSSYVSELPNIKINILLSELEKTENKKTEIYIGIKEKCTVDELEKALKAEIQNRKDNDIHKTTSYSALEFLEHEIKKPSDSSEIIEIKRK